MRTTRRVIVLAVGAISLSVAAAAIPAAFTWAGAVTPAGSWRRAIEVPGLGALNKGRFAMVLSVSCASAGNCVAGGVYRDRRGHQQGFVVSQRRGRWGTAIEVPGLGNAEVLSVSCASAGNCAAGGDYWVNRRGHVHGFVVSQ